MLKFFSLRKTKQELNNSDSDLFLQTGLSGEFMNLFSVENDQIKSDFGLNFRLNYFLFTAHHYCIQFLLNLAILNYWICNAFDAH